ncbi:MAG: hypothetical protein AAFY30_16780 [Cyanobacteria bacterium J06642_12]
MHGVVGVAFAAAGFVAVAAVVVGDDIVEFVGQTVAGAAVTGAVVVGVVVVVVVVVVLFVFVHVLSEVLFHVGRGAVKKS